MSWGPSRSPRGGLWPLLNAINKLFIRTGIQSTGTAVGKWEPSPGPSLRPLDGSAELQGCCPSGSPPCHVQKEQLRAGEGEDSPVASDQLVPSAHIRTVRETGAQQRLSILSCSHTAGCSQI